MPNSSDHFAKYAANRAHLNAGNGGAPLATADRCWAAVVAFYAALHLVDRLAARANLHPQRPGAHGKRLQFLASDHRPILTGYIDLQTASEVARYGTLRQFDRAFPGDAVQAVLIDQKLVAIEVYVEGVCRPAPPAGP